MGCGVRVILCPNYVHRNRHPLTSAELLSGSPYYYAENLVVFASCQQARVLNAVQEQAVHSIMNQRAEQCLDGLLMLDHFNPCCWRGWTQLVCMAFTEWLQEVARTQLLCMAFAKWLQEVARPHFSNGYNARLPRIKNPCKQIEVFATSSHV